MLKKQIKKIIEDMDIDETIQFHSRNSNGWKTDRVTRKDDHYEIYSQGQGWSDQVASDFDLKQTIKILWNEKPHAYYFLGRFIGKGDKS